MRWLYAAKKAGYAAMYTGTGNYHANTARLYTDFGLFTCNEEFAEM
jgi:polyphosphate kinase